MPTTPEPAPVTPAVTRASFHGRLLRLSAPRPMTLLPTRTWTPDEWEHIRRGHRAADMDERWHVLTEDHTVFLHRSWTGHGIYELTFAEAADGAGLRITAGSVESDPRHFRSAGPEQDRATAESVLRGLWQRPPQAPSGGLWDRLVRRAQRFGTGMG